MAHSISTMTEPSTMATRPQPDLDALFEPLGGQTFRSYVDFEGAIRDRFRDERSRFPSEFTYRDAISWAAKTGLVTVVEDQLVVRPVTQTA
jgi:hypothetical protein